MVIIIFFFLVNRKDGYLYKVREPNNFPNSISQSFMYKCCNVTDNKISGAFGYCFHVFFWEPI